MHSICRVFYGSGKFCSAVCRLIEAHLIDASKIIYYDLMLILQFNYICRQYAFSVIIMSAIVAFKRDLSLHEGILFDSVRALFRS